MLWPCGYSHIHVGTKSYFSGNCKHYWNFFPVQTTSHTDCTQRMATFATFGNNKKKNLPTMADQVRANDNDYS